MSKSKPQYEKDEIDVWMEGGFGSKDYWKAKGRSMRPIKSAKKQISNLKAEGMEKTIARKTKQLQFGILQAGKITSSGGSSLLDENKTTKKMKKQYDETKGTIDAAKAMGSTSGKDVSVSEHFKPTQKTRVNKHKRGKPKSKK